MPTRRVASGAETNLMVVHLPSHFGDIEILPASKEGWARIKYWALKPTEREALEGFLEQYEIELQGQEGLVTVPATMWEAAAALGLGLSKGKAPLSAVRFSSGEVQVRKGTLLDWFKSWFRAEERPQPVAAVQTRKPERGCPMPSPTDLKEAKAAAVVQKFLSPTQVEDFERHRAFIAIGGDTERRYRVTSRWAPSVAQFGVLFDLDRNRRICASQDDVPPSEEALTLKFMVENFESEFLVLPPGHTAIDVPGGLV